MGGQAVGGYLVTIEGIDSADLMWTIQHSQQKHILVHDYSLSLTKMAGLVSWTAPYTICIPKDIP